MLPFFRLFPGGVLSGQGAFALTATPLSLSV
jgi:hypothetical protein